MEDNKQFEYASPELVELRMDAQIVLGDGEPDSTTEKQYDEQEGDPL